MTRAYDATELKESKHLPVFYASELLILEILIAVWGLGRCLK
jgi:hypothetical protein